jgi:hypothetical protein
MDRLKNWIAENAEDLITGIVSLYMILLAIVYFVRC